jgi:hypothetical protein
MRVLGPDVPELARQDRMPNGRRADMVFVEASRITVVEIKKGAVSAGGNPRREDVIDQITAYIKQCRVKYPGRTQYRGFVVGTSVEDESKVRAKIAASREEIAALMFGRDIPRYVKFCPRCTRAVDYDRAACVCGLGLVPGPA